LSLTVFGLTGGIASGKSVVAEHWRRSGLPVVDADELARQAVAPGSTCLATIIREFGTHMLRDGALDRERMAAEVFADPQRLQQLSRIVHPEVRRLAAEHFERLARAGHGLACYELPLLYEVGLDRAYAPVVVVSAPDSTRMARLCERNGLSREQAEQRLRAQLPLPEKAARAAYVIDNSGPIADTLRQADEVLAEIRRTLEPEPSPGS